MEVFVKNGHGHLGYETVKSAVSQDWIDGLSCILQRDSDVVIFNKVLILHCDSDFQMPERSLVNIRLVKGDFQMPGSLITWTQSCKYWICEREFSNARVFDYYKAVL